MLLSCGAARTLDLRIPKPSNSLEYQFTITGGKDSREEEGKKATSAHRAPSPNDEY